MYQRRCLVCASYVRWLFDGVFLIKNLLLNRGQHIIHVGLLLKLSLRLVAMVALVMPHNERHPRCAIVEKVLYKYKITITST